MYNTTKQTTDWMQILKKERSFAALADWGGWNTVEYSKERIYIL